MRKAGLVLLVLAALALLGSLSKSATAATTRVGTVRLISDAGIFVALEKGYFRKEGIEVELPRFRTAGDMMAPLGTGELHIATGGISPGLFNAIARGIRISVVADKGSLPPGRGFLSVVIRKDLWDTGRVRSLKDLKGRPVGINAPTSPIVYQWAKTMESVGLKLGDLTLKTVPFPLMITALSTKALDASIIGEPLASLAEMKNVGVKFLTLDKTTPNMQIATIFYSKDSVSKNPELARRWMVAYIKGVRFYNDAIEGGGSKLEELINILVKHTRVKGRKVYGKMVWAGLNPDGHVNKESIMDVQSFFSKAGQVPKTVPIDRIVDDSFVDYAIGVLGKYRR